MATDVLTTIEASVRSSLADTGTVFPTAMIDAAIYEVVADISRLSPRELVHVEILHSRSVASGVTPTLSAINTWYDLLASGNVKPIDQQQGMTVTSNPAGTTFTEYTDYIIDYAQGRIQRITGGAMSATTFRVTYEKSLKGIDLSSLTDFISIDRVEIAKQGGSTFQEFSTFWQWGEILWLQSRDGTDQGNLAENDHVRIWYRGEHSRPGGSAGSYPAYMDDVVVKGAVAYALFSKHRERNLQAVQDLNDSRTQLAIADDDQPEMTALALQVTVALDAAVTILAQIDHPSDSMVTNIGTALDAIVTFTGDADSLLNDAVLTNMNASIETAVDAMATALGLVNAFTDTPLADAETALDTLPAILGSSETALEAVGNIGVSVDATLADTDMAALETAIKAALDAAVSSIAAVDAISDTPLADAEIALDALKTNLLTKSEALLDAAVYTAMDGEIETQLDGSNTILEEGSGVVKVALDKVTAHMETDTTNPDSAENQLKAGDSLINASNLGADVAVVYAKYAEAQVSISHGFISEANTRILHARAQIEEAGQRIQRKRGYLEEVGRRVDIGNTYVAEARERLNIAGSMMQAGNARISEAAQRIQQKSLWLGEVDRRINMAGIHVAAAGGYEGVASQYINEARERLNIAGALIQTVREYGEEAAARVAQKRLWLDNAEARVSTAHARAAESVGRLGIVAALQQSAIGYIQEATVRTQQIDRHLALGALYVNQARGYQEAADRENATADRFLFDAQERHRDYWEHLQSRVEMSWPNQRQVALRQNP